MISRSLLSFLSDDRIAISDSENLPATLASATVQSGHAEWNAHYERLAGTPLFAVLRQDSSMQNAFNSATPAVSVRRNFPRCSINCSGFRLPESRKPINCGWWPKGSASRNQQPHSFRDFLQGIVMLAQNGLNDPKLRKQMNPDERDA